MNLNAALPLIKEFEGLRLKAYLCPAKVWTIGWGTTKGVKPGMKITAAQAEALLMSDLRRDYVPAVKKAVKVKLNSNEFGALVSFCYNVGGGNLSRSTLIRKLNAGAPRAQVAQEFHKWVNGGGRRLPGLVRRRKAEAALFLRPVKASVAPKA